MDDEIPASPEVQTDHVKRVFAACSPYQGGALAALMLAMRDTPMIVGMSGFHLVVEFDDHRLIFPPPGHGAGYREERP